MKNPGLTFAALLLTAGAISLGLLIWGPKQHRAKLVKTPPSLTGEVYWYDPKVSTTTAPAIITPTPTPLPIATPVEGEKEEFIFLSPNLVTFRGDINGMWLILRRHFSYSGGEKGWEASYTSIESDYKPVVTKKDAKWEIVFSTDDITTEFVP